MKRLSAIVILCSSLLFTGCEMLHNFMARDLEDEDFIIGQLYADAGAQTAFPEYKQSGSVPLSVEQVYATAHDADVWLMRYESDTPMTLAQLGTEADVYRRFDAFKQGNVWGCNTRTSFF